MAPDLGRWDSFYVIVGSAAGALIGLQFVVMTLIAQRPATAARAAEAGAAFATPTIVHLSSVLFLAAVLRAPWESTAPVAAIWGAVGWIGLAYAAIVGRRIRKQKSYRPEFEDWLFHLVLPSIAYLALGLSAIAVAFDAREALFGAGGGALLLLFSGIHNAWDSTAWHVFVSRPEANAAHGKEESSAAEGR